MSIAITSNLLSTSDPSRRLHVFVQDGLIFSSLTLDYLPDLMLPLLDPDNTDFPMWKHCLKPLWIDKQYFSLAYTPLHPQFDKQFDVLQLPVTSRKFGLKSLLYSELRNGVNIQFTKYIYGLYLCLRTFNMPMHHMLNARVVHYRFRTLLTPTRLLITRPLPYAPQLH